MQYDSLSCEKIIEYIETKNVIYIDYNILVSSQNHVLIEIFKPLPKEKPEEALLTNILNLLFLIFKKQNQTENFEKLNIEKEYINKSYKLVKQFRETLKNRNTNLSLNLVIDLLLKILTAQQIPFAGKAEEGLQLMGVLESRNLDFKNLIVLGVNEGNLPAVSSSATFLSQSVRAAFGMPIVKHQDSVYAYLFYRMLQRAENITLIYNNVVSDTNSGEKSRFLLQLLHESGHEIIQKQFKEEILIAEKSEISVKQNETTLKILDSYIEKNGKFDKVFSPSAINTFLSCKLKYYFRYIANLKELRPVEEEISPASTGTIIHAILESIYKKLFAQKGNRIVEKEDFVFINTNIEKAVNEAFKNYYKIEENKEYVFENNMIIIKEVIIKYINTVLKFDYNYAPFEIVSMEGEKKYYTDISIKINETKQKVKIGGVIDRIDKKDSFIRVIDYKTGSNYSNAKSILDIFDSEKASKNSHIFQALFYSKTLFDNLNKPYVNIAPALFYLREMSSSYYNPFIKFDKEEVKAEYFINLLETFNEYLSLTLSSIFSSETIFDQTKDEANCRYCPFNTICNK
jgi:CRISPR/Cas system-associated exonuclease Cas4 (RecB family)